MWGNRDLLSQQPSWRGSRGKDPGGSGGDGRSVPAVPPLPSRAQQYLGTQAEGTTVHDGLGAPAVVQCGAP